MASELKFTVKKSGFQRYTIHQESDGIPVGCVRSSVSFNTFCKVADSSGEKLFRVAKYGGRKFRVVNYANNDTVVTVHYNDVTSIATVSHGNDLDSPWLNVRYNKKDNAFHVKKSDSQVTVAILSNKGKGIERLKPWSQMNLKISSKYNVTLTALILMSLIFKGFIIDRRSDDKYGSYRAWKKWNLSTVSFRNKELCSQLVKGWAGLSTSHFSITQDLENELG